MQVTDPTASHRLPPSAATIGFFDGVHRGHRFLIRQVKEVAATLGLCSSVVTFPTHPKQVLQPEFCPQLLSTPAEKLRLLEGTGIDQCVLLPFTAELSQLAAREFMQRIREEYNIRALIIGYDHRFGHNRTETFEDYRRYGEELSMRIVRAEAYTEGEDKVSSSAVRRLLAQGDVATAATFLGYPYGLEGTVTDGHKVGRKIGFPTANLSVSSPDKLIPREGVYTVTVHVNGRTYLGMLNIGRRPTLNNGSDLSIEVHILDFSDDIYRHEIRLELLQFLRPEMKFSSIDELVAQMQKDKERIVLRGEKHNFTADRIMFSQTSHCKDTTSV